MESTTTTTLVGEIMKAFNEKTFVVGNIGNPYTSEAAKTSEDSVTVAEISSFQLESTITLLSESKCDLKYYAGSLESPRNDGKICRDETFDYEKSDERAVLHPEL